MKTARQGPRDERARHRERGDFQTPPALARQACELLRQTGDPPATLVEPTCGEGSFLVAALEAFPEVRSAFALDLDPHHVDALRRHPAVSPHTSSRAARRVSIGAGDVFATPWSEMLADAPDPVWIVGNPPWVTNAFLGSVGSDNLPEKTNVRARRGIDAITGDSNFDISEAVLLRAMDWTPGRRSRIAMLCKESVARRVLQGAFSRARPLTHASFHRIDAARSFGAAVEAGLLVLDFGPGARTTTCAIHRSLEAPHPEHSYGLRNGRLVADADALDRWSGLFATGQPAPWRSGIKHDCARVMELVELEFDPIRGAGRYRNGLGETVALEADYVFPLLKSSDLAKSQRARPRRAVIVPQRTVGADTREIETRAPQTWAYLARHRARLDRRASKVYRGRPPFAVFGVGPYTFAPHKVAISGLYKKLAFVALGPRDGRPVVVDDTAYALACDSRAEASRRLRTLQAKPAQEFLAAQIFWEAKRPITVDLLRRLDLDAAESAR